MGIGSTLISDGCEECRAELLVPMFLRALLAFFTFLNILQTKVGKKTQLVENVRENVSGQLSGVSVVQGLVVQDKFSISVEPP